VTLPGFPSRQQSARGILTNSQDFCIRRRLRNHAADRGRRTAASRPARFRAETGTITLSGPSTILADDPRIREAYLGG
jgi:hypothetical protein